MTGSLFFPLPPKICEIAVSNSGQTTDMHDRKCAGVVGYGMYSLHQLLYGPPTHLPFFK